MNETHLKKLKATYADLCDGLENLDTARLPSKIQQIIEVISRDLEEYQRLSNSRQILKGSIDELNTRLLYLQSRLNQSLIRQNPSKGWWSQKNSRLHKVFIGWGDDIPKPSIVWDNVPCDPEAVYFATLSEAEAALEGARPLINEIAETYLGLRELNEALEKAKLGF